MENSQIKLKKPEGLYAALLTPFDEERKVNEGELRKLVTWLVDKGVDGIFPLGSCGEAIHLSFEERVRVVEVILQAVDGRVPVIPGASDSCASNVIKFIKELERLCCAGAVICPPYYLPISEGGVIAHYEKIIEAAPNFPIVLYNAPAFSMPLTYNVVEKLAKYPNVVSMKDSSGSMVDFMNFMNIAN
ncbi:MAG: dihydrodipicolinate synthase family protein, partial [Clostridia bacterium]|nr:dihydrodipicolinate synthase family protein [Clostridia bacterium]